LSDGLSRLDLNETGLKGLVADSLKAGGRTFHIEWPTILLAIGIYAGWLSLTALYGAVSPLILFPLIALVVLLQTSLQHEVLHGHPTWLRAVNRLFGLPALMLWLPYERYRQTHLTHHIDERLTDPLDDPESYYVTHDAWGKLSPIGRALLSSQNTLLGRITIGPFWSVAHFLVDEARRVVSDAPGARRIWAEHLLWSAPVIAWLHFFCAFPIWLYFIAICLPATGLMMIRSFAEHRAETEQEKRTAIVENSWFFGPLFLFNNLHVVHHEAPLMPWYRIPGWYRAHREAVIRANGGLVYNSYFDVARRYLLTPHDAPRHPLDRIPRN
jgi:fatty acid desaturase